MGGSVDAPSTDHESIGSAPAAPTVDTGDMQFSAGSLFASLVVSTLGYALFTYGKKQSRFPQLATGVVLMVYPYFVGGVVAMLGIGAGLILGLWFALRAGL